VTQLISRSNVILVDDDLDILKLFKNYLSKEGFNVHAFSNPTIAIEHIRFAPAECSLIITDVRMPEMSGFQLARKAKELNADVRIILTSAFEINMSEFETVLPSSKIDGFLAKPVSLKKMSQLIQEQLVGSNSR
jgi:DNA-binding NtrC family response regulator